MRIIHIIFAGPMNGWAVRLGVWLRSKGIDVGHTANGGVSRGFYGALNDPWHKFKLYYLTPGFWRARKANKQTKIL
jgi:hypothetical protein